MAKKCSGILLFTTVLASLLNYETTANSQATNFTVADALSKILRNLHPEVDEEESRSYSLAEGIWSPILEEWALQPRNEKVMKQRPSANFIVSRPTMSNSPTRPIPGPSEDVSETDLYLLGAIEKLVYRVDFMEKRLRRTEELLYYVMSGNNDRYDEDPCPTNFTRVGKSCYHFSSREFNWKSSASMCKSLGSNLAELETIEENQDIVTYLQSHKAYTGKDFWTGGLNPGLLWIWANSARPVASNSTSSGGEQPTIHGAGRCLKLAYSPALRSYRYQGEECSARANYLCEREDNRAGRALRRLEVALQQRRSG